MHVNIKQKKKFIKDKFFNCCFLPLNFILMIVLMAILFLESNFVKKKLKSCSDISTDKKGKFL